MNINDIESSVLALPERDGLIRVDDVAELYSTISSAQAQLREMKERLDQFVITWLPQNGGEMYVGEILYFVTDKKKVKVRHLPSAVTGLYQATGGDFDSFVNCLSVNAIKPGEAEKILGDRFGEFFETVYETGLDHKRVKHVAAVNPKFVK